MKWDYGSSREATQKDLLTKKWKELNLITSNLMVNIILKKGVFTPGLIV